MNAEMMRDKMPPQPSRESPEKRMPLPPVPPSRLGWRLTIGFFVEVITLGTLLVLSASGQFNLFGLVLALLAILVPLILAARGFLLMSQDETRSQRLMVSWEQSQTTAIQEGSKQEVSRSTASDDLEARP
jgi:hypothetical protein